MTRFLEFSTLDDAKAFQARMNALEGYPNAGTKTERYCLVTKHPSQKRWVAPVDGTEENKIAGTEKTALKASTDVVTFFLVEGG